MTRRSKIWITTGIAIVVIGVAIGLAVWAAGSSASAATAQPSDTPVATVTTVPVRQGTLSQTATAYGNIAAEPGAIEVLSAPVETRVLDLRVAPGQSVQKDELVVDVEPSMDEKLKFLDAQNGFANAKRDLANVKQRFEMKLATTTEMQQAQQSVQIAKAKLDDLQKRGAGESHQSLKATSSGVVWKIDVQEGALVPAGAPLVEVVPKSSVQVRLGVEPGEVSTLHDNQTVHLSAAEGAGAPVDATVRRITQRVNAATRLVDVFVAPTSGKDNLMLDQYVKAQWSSHLAKGLVVPRSAALPQAHGDALFVVRNGKAVKQIVKIVLENDLDAVVTGGDFKAGEPVVIAGNLELEDGMAVAMGGQQ